MEWTSELEKQLKYIGDCSRGYSWMYKKDSHKYNTYYYYLSNTSIVLGALSGGLSGLSLAFSDNKSLVLLSMFLAFGTSFCEGILQKIDYQSESIELKRQASKYSTIVNNIKRQLGLPSNLREKAEDYHRWITKIYDDLGEEGKEILPSTLEEYRKECLKSGLPFPDETNTQSNIVIHIEKGEASDRSNKTEQPFKEEKKVEDIPDTLSLSMKWELERLQKQ